MQATSTDAARAAELLNSFPQADLPYGSDTDPDSPRLDGLQQPASRLDITEAGLETRDAHKLLLAKSYFDCREFDRCAAVFLPTTLPRVPIDSAGRATGKAKATASEPTSPASALSQKALFLALYAKYLAGEKRRDEDSEMILGPADGGVTVNRELNGIAAILEQYFAERQAKGKDGGGWLEYLYGIILAKGKNEDLAKEWFIRSVNIYPFNWGAWQELANLLNTIEDVSVSLFLSTLVGLALTGHSSNRSVLDCPKTS